MNALKSRTVWEQIADLPRSVSIHIHTSIFDQGDFRVRTSLHLGEFTIHGQAFHEEGTGVVESLFGASVASLMTTMSEWKKVVEAVTLYSDEIKEALRTTPTMQAYLYGGKPPASMTEPYLRFTTCAECNGLGPLTTFNGSEVCAKCIAQTQSEPDGFSGIVHEKDEDCTVDPDTLCCSGCGVANVKDEMLTCEDCGKSACPDHLILFAAWCSPGRAICSECSAKEGGK